MEILSISKQEIPQIVSIHNLAFKDFFLTQLGDRFLNIYYTSVLNQKKGILLGCFQNNVLIGFCAATTHSKGFNTQLIIDNLMKYVWIGVKLIFSNPKAVKRLIKNLTKKESSNNDDGNYAELLSIGVKPDIQNSGIGKLLLTELEIILTKNEIKHLSLTTDFYNNDKTIGFYHYLGYKKMYEFITYPNRKMYRLIKSLQ